MEIDSDNGSNGTITPETKVKRTASSFTVLALLGFSIFLAGCTLSILAPFYSKEAGDHGLSVTSSGAVFSSAFVLQIVSTPIFGKYLHKIGSSRLFIFGSILSGVTNILFGFLPRFESGQMFLAMSLVIRSLTAIGESAMSTGVYPLAMRCDPNSQSTVLAVMETMFGAGTTIGPFVGGFLFEYGGFLTPFAVCGGMLLLCAGAGFFVLPLYETTSKEHVNDTDNAEDDEGTEVRVEGSATYRTLLSSPLMLVSAVVTFLTAVSTQWYQPSLEPYVREQLGLSPFQASLLFIIDGGVYSFAAPLAGWLLDKGIDSVSMLGVGSSVICIGYLVLAPAFPFLDTPSISQIATGAGIHGLGMAINFIATLTLMAKIAEKINPYLGSEQLHGMATSIWITAESFGGFVGAAGGGAAFDSFGWRDSCILVVVMQTISLVLVVGVSLSTIVKNVRRNKEEQKLLKILENKNNYGTINNNIV